MNKQQIQFAVATKDGTVVKIGRSQIIQPQIMYKGNGIKWFDDSKLLKEMQPKQSIQKQEREFDHMHILNRDNIAMATAKDLLDNDILDANNFSYDTNVILEYVQKTILEHLKYYSLLSGTVF